MSSHKDHEFSDESLGSSLPLSTSDMGMILNRISDAVVVFDKKWKILYLNEPANVLFRFHNVDVVGRNLFEHFPRIIGTDFETNYRKAQETGEPVFFESFFLPFHYWLDVRIFPTEKGYLVYYKDITDRKKKELSWNLGETLLWNISASENLHSAFEKVIRTLIQNTPWSFGQIWRFQEGFVFIHDEDPFVSTNDKQLIFREGSVGKKFSVKEGILKKVTESGELYFIPDLEADTELKRKDFALAAGFRSWMGIPVLSDGRFYEIELLSERVLSGEEAYIDLLRVVSKRFAEVVSRRVADEERKTFIELSLDMILTIDSDGNIQKANSSFRRILGYDRRSIKKKNIYDFIHPEDVGYTKNEIAKLCKEGHSYGFENRYITKNGDIRVIYWNSVHSSDSGAIFSVGRDKTEDRLATQKLQFAAEQLTRSKEELQHAQKIAKIGSWKMYFDGELTWSPGLYEIFGMDESEPPKGFEEFLSLIHPEDRERITKNYIRLSEEGIFEDAEFRVITANGTEKHLLVRGETLLDAEGRLIGTSGTMQDITEQKEWNDSMRQFQKMEAVGQLAGGMAHDFNNLLNVILANLDLLELKLKDSPELMKRVSSAQDAVKRGAEANRRLLSFSRRQAINPETYDVSRVVQEFAPVLTRIRNDVVTIDFSFEDFPLCCDFERNGLENALLNMGINSRDAMPQGGRILVSVSFCPAGTERAVVPGLQEMGDCCLISVRDEGIGMDAITRERIFEPFFTTKGAGKGTGLGMPMVYAFVQQSRGAIHVHSEPDKGTQVDIFLPLSRSVSEELVMNDDLVDGRIVIVEKNFKGISGLSGLLKRIGFDVLQVYDIYELKAILGMYSEIFAIFADEELAFRSDYSEDWAPVLQQRNLIPTSEWNSESRSGYQNHLKRPYSWSKVRRVLFSLQNSKNRKP
ncbi:PAS domain S-box protein [Leptospira wolffii serovar Khorat str. Khorat-H2]|nr:PAS domain S-box protein [Leptospira wolffii serovar Khorat str. Khorat-H2]